MNKVEANNLKALTVRQQDRRVCKCNASVPPKRAAYDQTGYPFREGSVSWP